MVKSLVDDPGSLAAVLHGTAEVKVIVSVPLVVVNTVLQLLAGVCDDAPSSLVTGLDPLIITGPGPVAAGLDPMTVGPGLLVDPGPLVEVPLFDSFGAAFVEDSTSLRGD